MLWDLAAAAGLSVTVYRIRLPLPQGPITSGVGEHGYKGPFDGLKRTAQTEGIAGLYRGFGAVILWVAPRVWHHHFVSLLAYLFAQ
jgi:hypothetical protein